AKPIYQITPLDARESLPDISPKPFYINGNRHTHLCEGKHPLDLRSFIKKPPPLSQGSPDQFQPAITKPQKSCIIVLCKKKSRAESRPAALEVYGVLKFSRLI